MLRIINILSYCMSFLSRFLSTDFGMSCLFVFMSTSIFFAIRYFFSTFIDR